MLAVEPEIIDKYVRPGQVKIVFRAVLNLGEGSGLGYEDMKIIEAYHFLKSVAEGKQAEPGFAEALKVAEAHAAMIRAWDSKAWEDLRPLRVDSDSSAS